MTGRVPLRADRPGRSKPRRQGGRWLPHLAKCMALPLLRTQGCILAWFLLALGKSPMTHSAWRWDKRRKLLAVNGLEQFLPAGGTPEPKGDPARFPLPDTRTSTRKSQSRCHLPPPCRHHAPESLPSLSVVSPDTHRRTSANFAEVRRRDYGETTEYLRRVPRLEGASDLHHLFAGQNSCPHNHLRQQDLRNVSLGRDSGESQEGQPAWTRTMVRCVRTARPGKLDLATNRCGSVALAVLAYRQE